MKRLSPSRRHEHRACSQSNLLEAQSVVCEVNLASELLPLNRGFEKLLLDAVDEGLACFGESTSRTIYYHLEKDFNIKRQDIPGKIEEFTDAIEKIFGAAAGLLEIQIMKKLHEKVRDSCAYFPEQKNLIFTDYIIQLARALPQKTSGRVSVGSTLT